MIGANPLFYGVTAAVLAAPPIDWLPPASEARLLLGLLLGAQAAIAALTLAVMLFVLQASARRDADDRMYQEYIRQSWARIIFWGSVVAVGVTGTVLFAEEFGARGLPHLGDRAGLPNLALFGVAAFATNLVLSLLLFERALPLTGPDRWERLRLVVFRRDTRDSAQAFLRRMRRAATALDADEPDFADMFPDRGEGPANQAITAILDDARRSIDERRQADFRRALDSLTELITHAMDEIEGHGMGWSPPGAQPEWPPLRDLGRNLFSLREDVVERGGSWYANQLASFDLRLTGIGIERRCGELFTTGLRGYASNYAIASRVGNHRRVFRQRAWLYLRDVFTGESDEELPYLHEAVRHHARLLFYAMQGGHLDDFTSLRDDFAAMLRNVRETANMKADYDTNELTWMEQVERDRRVVLMELGGVAMRPVGSGGLTDPQPYLDVVRSEYPTLEQLAQDMPRAVEMYGASPFYWYDLLDSASVAIEWRGGTPTNYSFHFFSVRLLELATDSMPPFDLGGQAWRILNWFTGNVGQLEHWARLGQGTSIQQQHECALGALHDAARTDELADRTR